MGGPMTHDHDHHGSGGHDHAHGPHHGEGHERAHGHGPDHGPGHSHDHAGHGHGGGHHAPANFGRAFAIGITLNLAYVVAAGGVVVNGVTAMLFMSGRKDDLNVRGAFLHMASDALIALGVVVTGGLILVTHWLWLDPAISLAISAVIVWGTWSLMRESLD